VPTPGRVGRLAAWAALAGVIVATAATRVNVKGELDTLLK